MNTIETGGPAFPMVRDQSHEERFIIDEGMTLRDYFAARAMQAAMQACDLLESKPCDFAELAYQMADAMLEERK